MIITATLIATAAAIHYTTTLVIGLMAGTAVVTGVAVGASVYFLKAPPQNLEDKAELDRFRQESMARQVRLEQTTKEWVDDTANTMKAVAATTVELQKHNSDSLHAFDKEIKMTTSANLQLTEVVTLLQRISESTSSEAQPLIEEIQRRLEDLTQTNHTLDVTGKSLAKTASMLEDSVAAHVATQKKLEDTIRADGLKIKALTRQLLDAKHVTTPDNQDIKIKAKALQCAENDVKKHTSKIAELELQLAQLALELQTMTQARQAQAIKMRELLAMNSRLSSKVRELGVKLEEQDIQASRRSPTATHALTLFGAAGGTRSF